MGNLKLKHENLRSALDRLDEAVIDFESFQSKPTSIDFIDSDRLGRSLRDSLIQRFEFTVDLFWKYIKRYLEEEAKLVVTVNAPKQVIRLAGKAKLLTEPDTQKILEMIDDRNTSSHIYKEEVADQISFRIPQYHPTIKKYTEQLSPTKNP